jgi:pilus assembly protein FimV
MSEAAIAGSFDIWRIYMEGRPRPPDERIDRIMNREDRISGTGEAIAVEEIRRDEPEDETIEPWEEVDREMPGDDDNDSHEAEEAEDEGEGFEEHSGRVLLNSSRGGFQIEAEPDSDSDPELELEPQVRYEGRHEPDAESETEPETEDEDEVEEERTANTVPLPESSSDSTTSGFFGD